jgi:hypothetical protein
MKKWLRIPVLLICLAFATALTWYNYHGNGEHSGLLTGVLLVLLYALLTTGVISLPAGSNIPFFNLWPRLSDAVKAAVSFALIFLWTPVAIQFAPDTTVGVVAIVLVPDAVFLLAALVYFSNGLSGNLNERTDARAIAV